MAGIRVAGSLRVPGDKSISHRALIFGALATGPAHVRGLLLSADVKATAASLRAMGWPIPPLAREMVIVGEGCHPRRPVAEAALPCANSGTTARLLSGVAAAQRHAAVLDGDDSLRARPMRRVSEPLEAMGAAFTWLADHGRVPMRIQGGDLRDLAWPMTVASAQVKSAILLAGVCAGVRVRVDEPIETRDHTERFLRAAGVPLETSAHTISLAPVERLDPVNVDVPGDPSSAAFFAALAAGAAQGHVVLERVLLNPRRTGFLRVLERMGATIGIERDDESAGDVVGDIAVTASPLRATTIGGDEIPSLIDEIPMLAALAALADGETVISGAEELRVKESDRIATTVANLRACGVDADERPDGLVVRGPARIRDAAIATRHDHRIAMAFGVLGALTQRDLRLDDPACVDVSFPDFWHELARLVG
ncbi:MAG: 3-phosphoshikimate 1-carboxyvinyltransferase [Gemmatimonadaceae bacterium]|nr:3-phosphoshikimate 1-carboxyvinyltransferase [Gemmatimonadaceae bacterium]